MSGDDGIQDHWLKLGGPNSCGGCVRGGNIAGPLPFPDIG